MPSRELGLPQCAKIRSGWFLLRDTLGVSDGSVEIANLGGQECRSALEVRVSLIGRDPVQRREHLLETLSLILDDAETLQRVIPLFPLARIGQPCQVGRRNIQMARLKGCLGGRRKRFRYGVDRGGALQVRPRDAGDTRRPGWPPSPPAFRNPSRPGQNGRRETTRWRAIRRSLGPSWCYPPW